MGRGRSSRYVFLVIGAAFLLDGTFCPAADTQPTALTEQQKIIHVLNRLGYGPRPGDVERVEKLGLQNYLYQQLHPELIDDSALQAELSRFDLLRMPAAELYKTFREDQQVAKERKQERKEDANKSSATTPQMTQQASSNQSIKSMAPIKRSRPRSFLAVAELQNAKIISAIDSPRQLSEVLVDFWSNHFNIDVRKGPCRVLKVTDEMEVIRPHVFGRFRDLLEASAKSPAMLHYLDNFQNAAAREISPEEQRRRQQYMQQIPGAPQEPVENKPRKIGGINENYAREIMELHTLGVDGGYTQKDVQEIARCFTGWTVDPQTGKFTFTPRRHDNGPKTVLGHFIPPNGGIKDGETVLDILASHPSTARFIATKLCQRLVADDPPPALVARVANVFQETGGDLRQVVQAIIYSPEFFSPQAYRAKIKSPFEFAVSAVRAAGGSPAGGEVFPLETRLGIETGATFGRGMDRLASAKRKSLNLEIIEMGQPLFAYQAPTGYPEDSRKWVNTGALIARMNFALGLAEHRVVDFTVSPADLLRGVDIDKPELVLNRLNQILLQGEMSAPTRATLVKRLSATDEEDESTTINAPELMALVLGSPEFQRH